jgi:hypothetical protein
VRANADLLWTLALHLVLTGVPGVAAGLVAMRLGARDVPLILAIALAVSGSAAFAAFWAYYANPTIGQAWDFLVLFGAIQAGAWAAYRGGLDRELLRRLRTPLLLWVLGCFFIVYLGFLHGGNDEALAMSATRFSSQLPSDNDIPRFFAEWFAGSGSAGTIPVYPPDWLMSDRPPLQVGYVLSQRAFVDGADATTLNYQILCVVIQQLWIVGMWAVLVAARLRPATRGLAMLAMLVSDVAILHGFFVWPKLIAAAFLLAALALVISPRWERLRGDPRAGALLGCLLALAMLAHGSSVYGVLPLLLIAGYRGLPSWRWLGAAAAVGIVLMGSWTAFQRYADPPGDRLVKWHLGGALEVDERGALETIVNNYGAIGFDGALENKWNNVEELSGWSRGGFELDRAADAVGDGDLDTALASIRTYRFFSLLPFLGLFLVAPFAMLLARNRPRRDEHEWRFALLTFGFVAIGCAFWVLLQWGIPGHSTTMLHAGALAIPLLAVCACVAGLRTTFPRLAVAVVAAGALVTLLIYVPSLTPPPGTSYSPLAALIATAALAGFAAVAFEWSPARAERR